MPHWFGFVDTSSPPILEGCNGDPHCVRERIYAEAPHGASVRSIHWVSGKDRAAVTVEGPSARDYLESTLQAEEVVQIMSAQERKEEKG
jgi:hypothetical protein